jgi:hypothetical protein
LRTFPRQILMSGFGLQPFEFVVGEQISAVGVKKISDSANGLFSGSGGPQPPPVLSTAVIGMKAGGKVRSSYSHAPSSPNQPYVAGISGVTIYLCLTAQLAVFLLSCSLLTEPALCGWNCWGYYLSLSHCPAGGVQLIFISTAASLASSCAVYMWSDLHVWDHSFSSRWAQDIDSSVGFLPLTRRELSLL